MSHTSSSRMLPVFIGLLCLGWCSSPAWAQLTQGNITNTNQVIVPDAAYPNVLAAFNARYNASSTNQPYIPAPGSINGVVFQNFDWLGLSQGINGPSTLLYTPTFVDSTGRIRNQTTTMAGTNANVLQSLANSINFFGGGEGGTFAFSGLPANTPVKVQLIGGDAGSGLNNWTGAFSVTANGNPVGTWNAADDNSNTATFATFTASTNGSGQLSVAVNQTVASKFAAIAGAVVLGAGSPLSFKESDLTNTNQIGTARLTAGAVAAAGSLRFASQTAPPTGSVNGVSFTDLNFLGGTQSLAHGISVSITNPDAADRSRFQTTGGTISGTNASILQGIANNINYIGSGESLTLSFTGLRSGGSYEVQLLGGDAGSALNNWNGDLNITANGNPVGLWNVGDDSANTARMVQFSATANGAGGLNIALANPGPAGQFAGLAGFVLVQTPEPSTIAVWSLAGIVLAGSSWRWAKRRSRKR